ncbi:hypothetical protein M5K25_013633 [Dendrobium thyrsiflorum]|uniref:Uncharacterized protein n=1 Tax=Dendrobium thyrsiflorum TaxID=117978 RepID=A0ABD0UTC7_DENTH
MEIGQSSEEGGQESLVVAIFLWGRMGEKARRLHFVFRFNDAEEREFQLNERIPGDANFRRRNSNSAGYLAGFREIWAVFRWIRGMLRQDIIKLMKKEVQIDHKLAVISRMGRMYDCLLPYSKQR